MTKPNLNILKIEAHHCYRCSNPFQDEDGKRKTEHHAIPQFLKPNRNVLIPLCESCHKNMNNYNVQSLPNFDAIENTLKALEDLVTKYKNKLERYRKDEK